MFNILDFIDSKDIREYNRNTKFTPIEQAVIIYYSGDTTIYQRIAAWKELLDTYSKEDFQQENVGSIKYEKGIWYKDIVADTVTYYEGLLADRYITDNVVFSACLYEEICQGPNYNYTDCFFSTYDKAFEFLKKEKKEYLDDEDLRKVDTIGIIKVHWLDELEGYKEIVYSLNNEWEIVDLYSTRVRDMKHNLGDFFVYIPLPFEKGTIVKMMDKYDTTYAVVIEPFDSNTFDWISNAVGGDCSDMQINLGFIDKNTQKYYYDHAGYLRLEVADINEIPENQNLLILLSEVYQGKRNLNNFLQWYEDEIGREYLNAEIERIKSRNNSFAG